MSESAQWRSACLCRKSAVDLRGCEMCHVVPLFLPPWQVFVCFDPVLTFQDATLERFSTFQLTEKVKRLGNLKCDGDAVENKSWLMQF